MVMRRGTRDELTHLVDIDSSVAEHTAHLALCHQTVNLGPPTTERVDCTICNRRSQRSLLTQDE